MSPGQGERPASGEKALPRRGISVPSSSAEAGREDELGEEPFLQADLDCF
jgi:hypothetical protein